VLEPLPAGNRGLLDDNRGKGTSSRSRAGSRRVIYSRGFS
jgi:hypothetical protein